MCNLHLPWKLYCFPFVPDTEINYDSWKFMNFSHWIWFMLYLAQILNLLDTLPILSNQLRIECLLYRRVSFVYFTFAMLVFVLGYLMREPWSQFALVANDMIDLLGFPNRKSQHEMWTIFSGIRFDLSPISFLS